MKRQGRLIAVVAAALALLTAWWWLGIEPAEFSQSSASKPPPVEATSEAGKELNVPEPSQAELARQGSPLAAELNGADHSPQRDVEILRELMSQYITALQRRGGPPVGDDADLVRVLTGRNPLRLVVIPPGHPAVSGEGRLLDRWGSPYHVHALSSQSYEFRSAGPDRRLFTADDLLAR